jgi:integrase
MRTYKRGHQWYVLTDDGRRLSLWTTDEAQARRNLADFLREEQAAKRPLTQVAEVFALYHPSLTGRPAYKSARVAWNNLRGTFGHLLPGEVTESVCKAWAAEQARAPHTIRQELNVLRTILNWGKKKGHSEAGYDVWVPSEPPPRDKRLTREQAAALLDACTYPHLRLFVILGLTTAARHMAMLDLTWDRVDFERRVIMLDDGRPHKKRRGMPPINDTLMAALSEARASALTAYVIEWAGQRVRTVEWAFRKAAARAGVPWCTAHTLRHTAATWLVEDGVSLEAVAQFLGHSSPAVTYKVYAKFSPTHQRAAAGALELHTCTPQKHILSTKRA